MEINNTDQKGHILLIVLLIAAAIGGYLLYSGKIDLNKIVPVQQTTPSPSTKPEDVVKTFYNTWLNCESEFNKYALKTNNVPKDLRDQREKCIKDVINKSIINPQLETLGSKRWCAQDLPSKVEVDKSNITNQTATVISHHLFKESGDNPIKVSLILSGNVWKISDTTCLSANAYKPSETTNWKTYENTKYNFSINYPSGWKLSTDNYLNSTKDYIIFSTYEDTNSGPRLELYKDFQGGFCEGSVKPKESIFEFNDGSKGKKIECLTTIAINFQKDGNNLWLIAQKVNDKNRDLFNQAISTFKFTDLTSCTDTKQITDAIKNSVSHLGKVEVYQFDTLPNGQYSWKFTDKEPFRTYNTGLPYIITYFGQKTEITDRNFKEMAISKIVALGYVQNEINTRPLENSNITINSYSRYGFTKNNERIVVNVTNQEYQVKNNKQIDLPENSSSIDIDCGIADQEFDDFYNAAIKNFPKFTSNTMLNIWEMHDGAVKMDVSNYPGGFGHAQYWIKKENNWLKVYEGQDDPKCSVFEKENVGRGFDCYDDQTGKQREAK